MSVDLLSNQSASSGGGAYVIGELTMDHSIISGNSSSNTGGGLKVNGTAVIDSSLLSTNSSDENGGGLYGSGTLDLTYSQVNDNVSSSDGGGLYWKSGWPTVERSDLRRNEAYRGGAFILAENPIFQYDVISGNNATTIGGGLYIFKSTNVSSTPSYSIHCGLQYLIRARIRTLCTNQTNPVV